MAAFAVFEGEVAAEGTFAVVTGEAARAACGDEVFCGSGGADLASLGRAGGCSMAVATGESFSSAVICMAESIAICVRTDTRRPVRFLIVTDTA